MTLGNGIVRGIGREMIGGEISGRGKKGRIGQKRICDRSRRIYGGEIGCCSSVARVVAVELIRHCQITSEKP